MLTNYLIGPFYDLKRYVVGLASQSPPTRIVSETALVAARAVLTGANCNLRRCAEENLHTGPTRLPADLVFDLLREWQLWPRSSFFACPETDPQGVSGLTYRWYKVVPIVRMRLKAARKPRYLIYDIVSGIGAGGYHSFLIEEPRPNSAHRPETQVSIFTTFPPSRLFFEGLHDQMNADIFRELQGFEVAGMLAKDMPPLVTAEEKEQK
jgi:hypothetical protein